MLRLGIAVVPIIGFVMIVGLVWPIPRRMGAAVVAASWSLLSQAVFSLLALETGWWVIAESGTFGIPGDMLFGWMMAWGAIPGFLADRIHPAWWVLGAFALDLLFLPVLDPLIVMGPDWIVGEALLLVCSFLPGLLAARWTLQKRCLTGRAVLQAIAFCGLLMWFLPVSVLAREGRDLALAPHWLWVVSLVMVPAGLLAVTAMIEFTRRGGGTPLPMDPPLTLVKTGPYSFVSNPMQISGTLLLLGTAMAFGSWSLALAAPVALVFSMGYATLVEEKELRNRFGSAWVKYRKERPPFRLGLDPLPRPTPATLNVDLGCKVCSQLARGLTYLRPVDIRIVHAASYDGPPLKRLRYADADFEISGLAALSYALDHTNLLIAIAGWTLRLPVVGGLLQLLADAVGFGPRTRSEAAGTCLSERPMYTSQGE